jgi:hypothetical protein
MYASVRAVLTAFLITFALPAWAASCPQKDAAGDLSWERITTTTVELSKKTAWQPIGEEIVVTVSAREAVADVDIAACFRWELEDGYGDWVQGPRPRLVQVNGSVAGFSLTVPQIPVPAVGRIAKTFFFVRDADALVVLRKGDQQWAYVVPFGVSHGGMGAASVTAFLLFIAGIFFLAAPNVSGGRLPMRMNRAILYVISSRAKGSASLSQFQLVLWLCVVGCCIVYVMVLSGDLIQVPDQLLGLLGISSGAFIGAKVMGDPPSSAGGAGREPRWQDLIEVDGVVDVTRLQMLVFTVVTAIFVVMRTFAAYEFPNLDNSYLVLMGIANGSYLLGKVKTPGNPADTGKAAAALPESTATAAAAAAVQPTP